MLYEFAMTPELFDSSVANSGNSSSVILVEILKGLTENGLLANLHGGRWFTHVRDQRVTSLSPKLKNDVITLLNTLRDRHRLPLHPKSVQYDPKTDQQWLNLALESHHRVPFHAIILSEALMKNSGHKCDEFVEFSSSLGSEQWNLKRKRTLSLNKTKSDYCKALAPVLRHAKSLMLIDPWLNAVQSRFFDTVSICSNLLGQRGHIRLHGRIDIHAAKIRQKPEGATLRDNLDTWGRKLEPLINQDKHKFRVFLWESIEHGETMHDRFILTDQCGISTPAGLDCRTHSHGNSTDWNLLDEHARSKRWENYSPSTSPFNCLGSRVYTP